MANIDEDYGKGFGPYQFGSTPEQFSDLELESESDTKVLSIQAVPTDLTLQGWRPDEVTLHFCDNRLYEIRLRGKPRGFSLHEKLQGLYGGNIREKQDYERSGEFLDVSGKNVSLHVWSLEITDNRTYQSTVGVEFTQVSNRS